MSSKKITSSFHSSSQDFQNDQNSNHSNIKQIDSQKAFLNNDAKKLYHYKSNKILQTYCADPSEYKRLKNQKRALSQYILTLQEGTIKALEEKQQQLEELQKSYQQFSFIKQCVQKEIQEYQQQILELQYELDMISYELREERELYNRQIQQKQSIVQYLTIQLTQLDSQIQQYNNRNAEIFQKIQQEEKKLIQFRIELQAVQEHLQAISRTKYINHKYKQIGSDQYLKESYAKTRKNSQQLLRSQLSEHIGNHRRYISEIKLKYEKQIDDLKKHIQESKSMPEQKSIFKRRTLINNNFIDEDSISSLPIGLQSKSYIKSSEQIVSINKNRMMLQNSSNSQPKMSQNQQDTTNQTQQDRHLISKKHMSRFIVGVLIGFATVSIFSKLGKTPV